MGGVGQGHNYSEAAVSSMVAVTRKKNWVLQVEKSEIARVGLSPSHWINKRYHFYA